MADISPAAQAAREAHRGPGGRFGAQPASEPTAVTLERARVDDSTAVRRLKAALADQGDGWNTGDSCDLAASAVASTGRPHPGGWEEEYDGDYVEELNAWCEANPGTGPDRAALNRIAVDLGTNPEWSADQIDQISAALTSHDTTIVDRDALVDVEPTGEPLTDAREMLVGSGFADDAVTVHDDHLTITPARGMHGLAIEVYAHAGESGTTWYSAERVGWSLDRDGQTDEHRATVCYDTPDVGVLVMKVSEEASSLDDDGHGGSSWDVWRPREQEPADPRWGLGATAGRDPGTDDEPPF